MRPSRITALPTPFSAASTAMFALGIIPALMVSSSMRPLTSAEVRLGSSSLFLSSTPAMSVSRRRRAAPSCLATTLAATSAFTLYVLESPSSSPTPMGAITGMSPMSRSSLSRSVLIATGSPTRPSFGSITEHFMRPSSFPLSPMALPPARLISCTVRLFNLPQRTISATSTTASSVTRIPFTNSVGISSFLSKSAIIGPPPCTMTTRIDAA
mmetsp:Transcript_25882/g.58008  ORF Transcript_25882/g.58008 Transcript_25882/m.58008 type:complete len:212 (-) Transcript_25882:322-957(-)